MSRSLVARSILAVGVLTAGAFVGACDDDDSNDDVIDPTIVEDPNVPFDPDVPEGVDTPTNEQENQGFDPDGIPGPEGRVTELPPD